MVRPHLGLHLIYCSNAYVILSKIPEDGDLVMIKDAIVEEDDMMAIDDSNGHVEESRNVKETTCENRRMLNGSLKRGVLFALTISIQMYTIFNLF